jgi:hypothetical protein
MSPGSRYERGIINRTVTQRWKGLVVTTVIPDIGSHAMARSDKSRLVAARWHLGIVTAYLFVNLAVILIRHDMAALRASAYGATAMTGIAVARYIWAWRRYSRRPPPGPQEIPTES